MNASVSETATVALIACGKQKRSIPLPARELYTGPLFTACRDWAEANTDAYYIASAKHFILDPDQVIEPYDQSLQDFDAASRRTRARQIEHQFRSRWNQFCTFEKGSSGFIEVVEEPRLILLAGRDYLTGFYEQRDWLRAHGRMSYDFETPLAGKGIGQQLAWLTRSARFDTGQLLLFPEGDAS